jgi:uncharacterized protein YlxP (DUF503 family)
MSVFVGLLTVELRLPETQTLKDKRQVVQSLLDRLSRRLNLSVAEVDYNDQCGRAGLAVAGVSNSLEMCHRLLDQAFALLDSRTEAEVVAHEREIL